MPVLEADAGSNHLLIRRPGSDKLAIFLAAINMRPNRFNFKAAASRLDVNVLLLNNGDNGWYQHGAPAMGSTLHQSIANIKRLADELGASQIYTIGSSMGGYGAALFAARLGTKALAWSCDTLLKSPYTRSLRYLKADAPVPFPDLAPVIEGSDANVTMILGEMDAVDLGQAARLAHLPNVSAISLRGVDHYAASYIKFSNRLNDILSIFVNDRPMPSLVEHGEALKVPDLVEVLFATHEALERRAWETAEQYARDALGFSPVQEAGLYGLSRALLGQNRFADAITPLSTLVALVPHFMPAHFLLTHALRSAGHRLQATQLLTYYPSDGPDAARAHFSLGQLHTQSGRIADAIACIEKALELQPDNEKFANRLITLRSLDS